MLESYYRNRLIRAINDMNRYSEQIGRIDSFEEAVTKYQCLNNLHDRVIEFSYKVPNTYVENKDLVFNKERDKMDDLCNLLIISALTKATPKQSNEAISKIELDLKHSFGYGFDRLIREYLDHIEIIKNNLDNIFFNYRNGNLNKDKNGHSDTLKSSLSDESAVEDEPLYNEIVEFVVTQGKASASLLQRKFKLGYNRAARAIDILEDKGIIGQQIGSMPRKVLISVNESNCSNTNSKLIDFNKLYGMDYKSVEDEKDLIKRIKNDYENNIQELFDKKDLDIVFDASKKINIELLNNTLFTNSNEENMVCFINKLLSSLTPNEMKLLLIDFSKINLLEYNSLPSLLFPVLTNQEKIHSGLNNIKNIIDVRYDLLIKGHCKSIEQYNEKDKDDKLNYVVVIISEIQEIVSNADMKQLLIDILMGCSKVGVKIVAYSKFSKKNIQLYMLEDLFDVYDKFESKILDVERQNDAIDIKNIDNDMNGFDFEKYSSELLRANGFDKVSVTQFSSDFGVDVIAYKDDIKYSIQCKKYSSSVGIKAVQEVIASKAMNDCHVAAVLTNNYFTKSAKELAKKNNVLLWDRNKLIEMMEKMK